MWGFVTIAASQNSLAQRMHMAAWPSWTPHASPSCLTFGFLFLNGKMHLSTFPSFGRAVQWMLPQQRGESIFSAGEEKSVLEQNHLPAPGYRSRCKVLLCTWWSPGNIYWHFAYHLHSLGPLSMMLDTKKKDIAATEWPHGIHYSQIHPLQWNICPLSKHQDKRMSCYVFDKATQIPLSSS